MEISFNEYDLVKNQNLREVHEQAFKHRRASLVGSSQYKDREDSGDQPTIMCNCCGRTAYPYIDIDFKITSLGFLGAGYPLYFVFNRLCWTLLLALFIVTKFNKTFYLLVFSKRKERIVNQSDFMAIVMFSVFFLITMLYGWYMSYLSIVIDENDTSPEDYSIRVSNIPVAIQNENGPLKIDEELKTFFQNQYRCRDQRLKVEKISLCYNLDPLSKIEKKKQVEVEAMKKAIKVKSAADHTERPVNMPFHGVLGDKNMEETDKSISQILIERISNLQKSGFVDNKIMFIGEAIVSFERQEMKETVQKSEAPAFFYGQKLEISKAENPQNIFWYNLHLDSKDYKIRGVLSVVCCSCIFMVSLGIQILMNHIRIQIMGTKYETKLFTFLAAIIVNLMNIFIPGVFLRFFSRFEGHRTHSQEMLSFSRKCIFLQMMNTLVVPLIVYNLFRTNQDMSYVQKQYGVLCRNELFGFIMTVIPGNVILQQIKIFLFQRGVSIHGLINKSLNVKDLYNLYQYLDFGLEKKYCDSIKSIMLAFAFGVDLPKIILYALVNMFLSGYIHRYYLVRYTTVKHNVSAVLNQQLFPLLYLGLSLFLLTQKPSPIKAILILISLSFYFLPIVSKIKNIVNRSKNQKDKNKTFTKCLQDGIFQIDYNMANPARTDTNIVYPKDDYGMRMSMQQNT